MAAWESRKAMPFPMPAVPPTTIAGKTKDDVIVFDMRQHDTFHKHCTNTVRGRTKERNQRKSNKRESSLFPLPLPRRPAELTALARFFATVSDRDIWGGDAMANSAMQMEVATIRTMAPQCMHRTNEVQTPGQQTQKQQRRVDLKKGPFCT
jgi:hypothetical protein